MLQDIIQLLNRKLRILQLLLLLNCYIPTWVLPCTRIVFNFFSLLANPPSISELPFSLFHFLLHRIWIIQREQHMLFCQRFIKFSETNVFFFCLVWNNKWDITENAKSFTYFQIDFLLQILFLLCYTFSSHILTESSECNSKYGLSKYGLSKCNFIIKKKNNVHCFS